ncbi:hypothetical protein DPEC_G00255270 [Dallia pectoralis]|uniref:Uncharacterized protein n=1 Tax=Dallia pectoralis TaxID=75939 RepID=A0ACC2FUF4_DALPE|nr:hypothetical protein DPEC_G00255270 [Dallia pectoralis]
MCPEHVPLFGVGWSARAGQHPQPVRASVSVGVPQGHTQLEHFVPRCPHLPAGLQPKVHSLIRTPVVISQRQEALPLISPRQRRGTGQELLIGRQRSPLTQTRALGPTPSIATAAPSLNAVTAAGSRPYSWRIVCPALSDAGAENGESDEDSPPSSPALYIRHSGGNVITESMTY